MSDSNLRIIKAIRLQLAEANRVLIITGAGLSADSGMPTYRGLNGIYNGLTQEGIHIEEAISGPMLRSNPGLCWKYLLQIGKAAHLAQPNEAHYAISRFVNQREGRILLTQNVDGLHEKSGISADRVINIHGTMKPIYCTNCEREADLDMEDVKQENLPPRCMLCEGLLRPNIVLYEEALQPNQIVKLEKAYAEDFDAVVCIGTTGLFPYVSIPVKESSRAGKLVIDINPDETSLSEFATYHLKGQAMHFVPMIIG